MLEEYGLSLGDTLHLARQEELRNYLIEQMGRLYKEHPDMPLSLEGMFESYPEEIGAALDKFCDCFTIIGSVNSGSSAFDSLVFTPGMETTKTFMGDNLLEFVEFRIPDNSRAREMKNLGEELTHHRSGEFSIDIEKLESVERTAALLETLYPIVIALALVIGGCLCMLIILQSTKEAAIMRILGTTKHKTRAMLSLEQILLALSGLALGLAVMAAIHRAAFLGIAPKTGLFAGVYLLIAALASLVSAAIATKKNLLELLQTKE